MNEDIIYKFINFINNSIYLTFVFITIQISLLWNDVDKSKLKFETSFNNTFFQKNSVYVFSFSLFFIIREFFERIMLQDVIIYFRLFHTLALICLFLFSFEWYRMLKKCASKKPLPLELTDFKRIK